MDSSTACPSSGHSYNSFSISGKARVHAGDSHNHHHHVYVLHSTTSSSESSIGVLQGLLGFEELASDVCSKLNAQLGMTLLVERDAKNDPESLLRLITLELDSCTSAVHSVSSFFKHDTFSSERASKVPAAPMLASLADGIVLLNQLRQEVVPILAKPSSYDQLDLRKLQTFQEKLQWQSRNWQLHSALCCLPDDVRESTASDLEDMIDARVARDSDLRRRIEAVEEQLRRFHEPIHPKAPEANPQAEDTHILETSSTTPAVSETQTAPPDDEYVPPALLLQPREFETEQDATRVHRRAHSRSDDISVSSSTLKESLWSWFSRYSLADISILSVIGLPLHVKELNWFPWSPPSLKQASAVYRGIKNMTHPFVETGPTERKIAVVGSRGTNKSSLTVQFVDGHYVDSYYPAIENTCSKIIQYQGRNYATEIVGTAGQDEYSILNSKLFVGTHGYMIVYSVSSRDSFHMVQIIHEKILNHLGTTSVPVVIVGNHSETGPKQRQVSPDDGQNLAQKLGCAFTEASARYNENVTKAFEMMMAEIEKGQPQGLKSSLLRVFNSFSRETR